MSGRAFREHSIIFSIDGRREQARWCFALERARWPMCFISGFRYTNYSIESKKIMIKELAEKKDRAISVHEARYSRMQIMTLKART